MSLRTTYESELDKLPDIFLCANDFVAMDAMAVLRKRGIRVPDDVLFCGFDDSPESRLLSLTTVHIHTQIMAF
jgi:LacI family transcriptional regulator